ncbi:hypothetical protein SDRG_04234 [Saprolegnia diclina VS20]|uniref:Uncharacterized protein n=1 Tax=Saprolegnia diclina (strain VS20) TaxID=1156394 RepID=T0S0T0_SAPDV|nr:hypothetical protein SDRG_04234 [Saprolegnia diclina VS20]EQC38528.1 hypothetical protein SDRG_04234 [Saprolegnia diclina VS20]|eukprot:XP_008608120.1 hypothetical protein SDRG_04234 [Saprolegnia diclina VS20]
MLLRMVCRRGAAAAQSASMRAFLAFVVALLVLAEAKTNTSAPSIVPVTTTPAPTTETPVPTTTAAPTTTPVPTTTAPPTTTPAPTTTVLPTTTPPPTPPPTTATPEPTTEEPTPAPTTRGMTRPAPTTAVAVASDDNDTMTYALIGGGCGLVMVLAVGISYTLAKSRQRVSDYEFDKKSGLSPLDTFRSGHNVVTLSGRLTAQYDMTPFGNPAFDVVEPPPPMYSMQHYEYPSSVAAPNEASFSAESGYSHIPSFQTDSDIFDSQYSLHSANSDVAYSTDSFSDTSSDYGGRYSQSCEI